MNKKVLVISLFILIIVLFGLFYSSNQKSFTSSKLNSKAMNQKEIIFKPYTAKFAIYTNGTFRIFSDTRYHNKSEKVYINPSNPNLVNVSAENITWADFFKTLPMNLDPNCLTTGTSQEFCTNSKYKLQFFINGVNDPDALSNIINSNDMLLITYGPQNSDAISSQINYLKNL